MKQGYYFHKGEHFFRNDQLLYVNRSVEDFHLPLHEHDFIEYAYVSEGKGFHHIENNVYPVCKGQLFILPVGVSHVFRPTSATAGQHPLIVYNCIFSTSLTQQLLPIILDSAVAEHVQALTSSAASYFSIVDSDGTVESLFLALYREYSIPRSGSPTYLLTLLVQLIIATFRLLQERLHAQLPLNKHADFHPILGYLEQHYSEDLTISHMAEISQWSERHFQRLFKQHTAQTFKHYLQNLRIQKSCECLRHSQLKVSTIAEAVGYKDIDAFMNVFKRIVGRTPSEYRRLMLQPQGTSLNEL
ncbi:HTH-type transcriptional activator RhaR [compost metagenome]